MPTLGGSSGGGGGGAVTSVAGRTGVVTLATADVANLDTRLGQGGPFYGLTPQNFRKWRKALARVRTGEGYAKLLCVGDSLTQGGSALYGTNPVFRNNWPHKLQIMMNAYYAPTQIGLCSGGKGDQGLDTRFTLGTGWSWAASGVGFATHSLQSTGGTAGTMAYAPGYACDTADIYYKVHNSNQGNSSVSVDGGSSTTLTGVGTPSRVQKTTITFTLGSAHVITLTGATGGVGSGNFDLIGIDAYDSTTPCVRVGLLGRSSSKVDDWRFNGYPGSGFQSLDSLAAAQPDLTIINLGVNDAGAAVSLASYISGMAEIIQVAQLTGDVLLTGVIPSNNSTTEALELSYSSAGIPQLATTYGCGVVDWNARWGTFASANAAGLMVDNLHPTGIGYADMAQAIFNALKTI